MRSVIVLACVCVSLQVSAAPQDTAVKSVRISLRPKPAANLRVTIENLRDSPLVELMIGFFPPGDARPRVRHYSNLGGYLGGSDVPVGLGPRAIAPHERRVLDIPAHNGEEQMTAALTGVVFADNYYEGVAEELAAWREKRQTQADDLGYWIRAIDTMPRDSADAARRHLADRAVERAGQVTDVDPTLRGQIWNLAHSNQGLPNLLASMDRMRETASRQLTALRPSLAGSLSPRPVRSAALSSEPTPTTTYVVVIENAGSAPLEAWGWEYMDARSGRPNGGTGTDMGELPPGVEAGKGHIAPGEAREFPFGAQVKDGDLPPVRMKYVLFEDLSFEGNSADRDTLFRERERRADDIKYVIGVLRRAAAEPANAVAVLTAARAERARQLQEQGRRDAIALWTLDELIRDVKASPANFAASVAAREASLESQRQRLVRHLSR